MGPRPRIQGHQPWVAGCAIRAAEEMALVARGMGTVRGVRHTGPMTDQYYQEDSQATPILVLGILSLVLCQVLGPFAWVMGNKELAGIDAGQRAPENRGTAQAGRILGIISTVLLIIGIGFFVIMGIFILIAAAGS